MFSSILNNSLLKKINSAFGNDVPLYLVGGSVRSVLMNECHNDIDLACALSPNEISDMLKSAGIRTIPSGLKHQTVMALLDGEQNTTIEITTFRTSGMKPEGGIRLGSSIEEDLAYRDFTINAIAVNVHNGQLIDPFCGQRDIERCIVRAVGNAQDRFNEDPLRMLRGVRFCSTLDFELEAKTKEAILLKSELLAKVSVERIREEFSKILCSQKSKQGLLQLYHLGLLVVFLPEVSLMYGFEQNSFHYEDLLSHTLTVVERCEPELILRLAALFHDVGKPASLSVDEKGERHFYLHEVIGVNICKSALDSLRYSKSVIDTVCCLVSTHMRPLDAGLGGIRRLLKDTKEQFETWRALKIADSKSVMINPERFASDLKSFDEKVEMIKNQPDVSPLRSLAVNGYDLIEIGIKEGPKIGAVLKNLHERVLDEPTLNTKEQLLSLAKRM